MSLKVIPLILLLSSYVSAQKNLQTFMNWMTLEYKFPTDNDRQYAIDNGLYKPNAGVPIDIAVEYKSTYQIRLFHTIPRFTDGIPYTLATVTKSSTTNGPILTAYPNYFWHNVNNAECKGITSAMRIVIDECNYLWVLDSGIAKNVQMCPPQLLVFDLQNDVLIRQFQFPRYLYTPSVSLFVSLAVDIIDRPPAGRCRKAMAYVADTKLGGLVVYNVERRQGWRIEHELMLPQSAWTSHTIGGQTIELSNGIFSLNISPHTERNRFLFFHAQSDDRECSVPLHFLNNQLSSLSKKSTQFQVLGSRGIQSAMEVIDSDGNMFGSTNDRVKIFTWNINTPYRPSLFKIVANNPDQLQYLSGMKVVKNPIGQSQLWVLSNRYQKTATNTRNFSDINYQILFCLTEDLLTYEKCTQDESINWANFLYQKKE